VVILDPLRNVASLAALRLPPRWGIFWSVLADSPPECAAVIIDAKERTRKYGGDEAEVRAILKELPFVRIAGE
jgi:hypothetical protein